MKKTAVLFLIFCVFLAPVASFPQCHSLICKNSGECTETGFPAFCRAGCRLDGKKCLVYLGTCPSGNVCESSICVNSITCPTRDFSRTILNGAYYLTYIGMDAGFAPSQSLVRQGEYVEPATVLGYQSDHYSETLEDGTVLERWYVEGFPIPLKFRVSGGPDVSQDWEYVVEAVSVQ